MYLHCLFTQLGGIFPGILSLYVLLCEVKECGVVVVGVLVRGTKVFLFAEPLESYSKASKMGNLAWA